MVILGALPDLTVSVWPSVSRASEVNVLINTFTSLARLTDGQTLTVRSGKAPRITIYVPYLSYYSATGTPIGLSYSVQDGSKVVARAIANAPLGTDQSVSFTPAFTPAKGHTYTVTAVANEPNGHSQTRITLVKVA